MPRSGELSGCNGRGDAAFGGANADAMTNQLDVRFDVYYTYDELTGHLKRMCDLYPRLAAMESIGKSYQGRDVWVLTLTDTDAGAAEDKPAYYIDANHHAGEVTGSMTALYTAVYLLENFGTDSRVTDLLRRFTFYIVPRVSPDGSERYLTSPDMLRSTLRPWPARGEEERGLSPCDMDDDGLILQMRVPSEEGAWKISASDPRLMVLRGPDDDEGSFYDLYPEGRLREYDGVSVTQAPPRWGLDLNRNYPMGWRNETEQRGAGPHALSEPETHNIARFFDRHRNIAGVTSYHTTGGIILRPPCAGPDSDMDMSDLRILQQLGDRGEQLTGYPCQSVYDAMTLDKKRPSRGSFIDFAYELHGLIAFAPELWNLYDRAGIPRRCPEERYMLSPEERERDDLAVLRWIDDNSPGSFHTWREFEHPQLGAVQIGGIDSKFVLQNPPVQFLEEECHKSAMASLVNAAALPRLRVTESSVDAVGDGLYRLTAVIENAGWLPTHITSKGRGGWMVPPRFHLRLPEEASLLIGEERGEVGHLDGRSRAMDRGIPERTRKLQWLIRSGPGTGGVELRISGDRCGSVDVTFELC
ncbi:MAG: M14 family metallopeptidase [Bacillota bacterium]